MNIVHSKLTLRLPVKLYVRVYYNYQFCSFFVHDSLLVSKECSNMFQFDPTIYTMHNVKDGYIKWESKGSFTLYGSSESILYVSGRLRDTAYTSTEYKIAAD